MSLALPILRRFIVLCGLLGVVLSSAAAPQDAGKLPIIDPGDVKTLREHFVGSLSPTEVEQLAHGLAAVSRGLEARGKRQ